MVKMGLIGSCGEVFDGMEILSGDEGKNILVT